MKMRFLFANLCFLFLPYSGIAQTPLNDECNQAFQLSPSLFCSPFFDDNEQASQSLAPAQNCNGFTATSALDVWFSFRAVNATDSILVDGLGGFDAVVQLFTGSCNNLIPLACMDNPGNGVEKLSPGNLVPGVEYFVRIYGWNGATGNFSICQIYWGPPANDACEDAILLTAGDTCQFTDRNTFNGTPSSGFPACSGVADDDVWFRFVAQSNGVEVTSSQVFVTGRAFFIFDAVLELYESCAPSSFLKCANIPPNSGWERLRYTSLVPGQIYYIRLYHSGLGSRNRGFSICVRNAPCNAQLGQAKIISPITSDVVSNGSVRVGVASHIGNLVWEQSENGIQFVADSSKRSDTVVFIPKTSQTKKFYFRAKVWDGICDTLYSDTLEIMVRCHNPFAITNLNDLVYITKMEIPEGSQTSTFDPLGGAYQDFRKNPISLCLEPNISNQRNLRLEINNGFNAYQRYIWIDFNQNGSFGDVGELLHNGPPQAGSVQNIPLNFSSGLAAGQYTMRIAVIWASAGLNNLTNPCDNKAILYGEIEEYTLLIRYKPILSAGVEQFVCGPLARMQARKPGPGYVGTWTKKLGAGLTGAGLIQNPADTGTNISGLLPGLNAFYWTVSGPCGTFSDSINIHYLNQKADAGANQLICSTATVLNGNPPPIQASGVWSIIQGTGVFFNPQAPNSPVSGLATGVNRFVWTQSSAFCPTSKDTVVIETKAPPNQALTGNSSSICGNAGNISANNPTVGTGVWTLISGTGNIASPNAANSAVSNLSTGQNIFRWTISNAPCPSSFAEIILTSKPYPMAEAGADVISCNGLAELKGRKSTGAIGQWTLGLGSGNLQNQNADSTLVSGLNDSIQTFIWTVTLNGCVKKDTVIVRRYFNPLNLGYDTTLCADSSLLLSISPSSSNILWSNGNATPQLLVADSGLYWVEIKTQQNCIYRDSIQVSFSPCTSVKDREETSGLIQIFPNPCSEKIKIQLPQNLNQKVLLAAYDLNGKLLKQASVSADSSIIEMETSNFPAGIFTLQIRSRKGKWQKMVSKQ